MARNITTAFRNAITADTVAAVLLFSAEFDEGDVNFWSGYGDITWNSITFTGAGDLGTMSEIEETDAIQANGIAFQLSGIPSSLVSAALSYAYQGRPVKLWLAPTDLSTGAIIADPFLSFSGKMDTMTIEEGADTATITLTAESDLVDLNRPRERRYTHEDQIAEYPGDLGLEYVAGLIDKEISWGVPSPAPAAAPGSQSQSVRYRS